MFLIFLQVLVKDLMCFKTLELKTDFYFIASGFAMVLDLSFCKNSRY